jgi:hypothetical protein
MTTKLKIFTFRGKEEPYDYEWINEHCFTFNFGYRDFKDENGNKFFMLCQYEDDTDSKFFFEKWYEYDLEEADYITVTEEEREYIKQFMIELIESL